MNPRVIAHPANLQGRDFIVGDLHGHPDVLRRCNGCLPLHRTGSGEFLERVLA
jgi:hypothetical protein